MSVEESRAVVAVVDDDPKMLETLQDLLEFANFSVRCFPSAAALLASGLSGVDLLVSDVSMPGMDGFELRDAVEKLRPELHVILITGRDEIVNDGGARGVSGFFHKPFDTQALLNAINDALEHGKAARDGGPAEPA
jgi:FixJ family two-component response regulator